MACVGSSAGGGNGGDGQPPFKHPWEKEAPTGRIVLLELKKKKKKIPCVPHVPLGDMSAPRRKAGVVPPGATTTSRKAKLNVRTGIRRDEKLAALSSPEQKKKRVEFQLAMERKKKAKQREEPESSDEEFVEVLEPDPEVEPELEELDIPAIWRQICEEGQKAARLRKAAEKQAAKEKKDKEDKEAKERELRERSPTPCEIPPWLSDSEKKLMTEKKGKRQTKKTQEREHKEHSPTPPSSYSTALEVTVRSSDDAESPKERPPDENAVAGGKKKRKKKRSLNQKRKKQESKCRKRQEAKRNMSEEQKKAFFEKRAVRMAKNKVKKGVWTQSTDPMPPEDPPKSPKAGTSKAAIEEMSAPKPEPSKASLEDPPAPKNDSSEDSEGDECVELISSTEEDEFSEEDPQARKRRREGLH